MGLEASWNKLYRTLTSVRTGIFFIIVVGIFSALGTVILQRPTSEPEAMQRAYSPETLLWLDRLGLTDIFHAWWFVAVVSMFCICLVFVTMDRWPNTRKIYATPVRFAGPSFRACLPQSVQIAVADEAGAYSTAERVLSSFGFKPERVTEEGATGLYAEKQRFSVLAVYLVHLSLLFIFAGYYIVDGIVGYRGNVMVPEGQARGQITLRDNRGGESKKTLPFLIRCDGAGEETYADGRPKKWWSKLALIENGKEVASKTIAVNDPFVYKGIRIYQASMGQTGTPKTLTFTATPKNGGAPEIIRIPLNGQATLADGESLSVLRWVPDFYIQDNEVYNKSNFPDNPAVELGLTNARGETKKLWIFYLQGNTTRGQDAPYEFAIRGAQMTQFTGLQISHHPGQYGVWVGVVLMAFGLPIAFYAQHQRIWTTIVGDDRGGKFLWMGGIANKNRDRFQNKFEQIKTALQKELGANAADGNARKREEKTLTKA